MSKLLVLFAVTLLITCPFFANAQTDSDFDQQDDDSPTPTPTDNGDGGVIDVNQNVISTSHYGASSGEEIGIDKELVARTIQQAEKEGQARLQYRINQMTQEEQLKNAKSVERDKLHEEEKAKSKAQNDNKQKKFQERLKEEDEKQKKNRKRIVDDAVAQAKAQVVDTMKEEETKMKQQVQRKAEWQQDMVKKGGAVTEQEKKSIVADNQIAAKQEAEDKQREGDMKARVVQYDKSQAEIRAQDQEQDKKVAAAEVQVKEQAQKNVKAYEQTTKAAEPKQKAVEEQGVKSRQKQQDQLDEQDKKAAEQELKKSEESAQKGSAQAEAGRKRQSQQEIEQRRQNERNAKANAEQTFKQNMNNKRNAAANTAYSGQPNIATRKPWFCFSASTPVIMNDGSVKSIDQVRIGDTTLGGRVTGVMVFETLNTDLYDYDGIVVAGVHKVHENGAFVTVEKSKIGKRLLLDDMQKPAYLYDFDSSNHRIHIFGRSQNVTFTDFSEVELMGDVENIELSQLNVN